MAKKKERRPGGLCVTRREGESVFIGEARVYVQRVRGNSVHLVIEAPPDIPLLRYELHEKPKPNAKGEPAKVIPIPTTMAETVKAIRSKRA